MCRGAKCKKITMIMSQWCHLDHLQKILESKGLASLTSVALILTI